MMTKGTGKLLNKKRLSHKQAKHGDKKLYSQL